MSIDTENILAAVTEHPALRISAARAAEIAAEIAALELACDQAVLRFGGGNADGFAAELLRHSRPEGSRR